MKKSSVAAIATALAIGTASTAFASSNPFSDVPSEHWSFDAVSKLAQEGVIEGYGDGTFNGNAHITRYEMAQMVAKAMAKSDELGASDQALVERLAAEYAEELNNLGVRVAALEKKADNIKIDGLLRLDGAQTDIKGLPHKEQNDEASSSKALKPRNEWSGKLRLDVTAQANEIWQIKGRLEGVANLKDGGTTENGVDLVRAYAHGKLFGGADAKFGEFGVFDAETLTNGGLLLDTELSGLEFKFGNVLQTTLSYGRLSGNDYLYTSDHSEGSDGGPTEYSAIQFTYNVNDRLALAAGWHHLKNKAKGIDSDTGSNNNAVFPHGNNEAGTDTNNIWTAGFDYRFNKDLTFGGLYANSNVDASPQEPDDPTDDHETSYSVQLTYRGAKAEIPHSYGIWIAYRQIGGYASINPTYDGVQYGMKGYEIGADYTLAKNVLAKVVYFDGKTLDDKWDSNDDRVNRLFGRLEFSF